MSDFAPLRILLVDDDDVDREHIRRLLVRSDLIAQIDEAEDAASALSHCRDSTFDCVLLDYLLPDLNGLQLVAEFTGESTAVVMLTGLGNEAVAVEAMKRGATDYLHKDSVDVDKLRRAIINAVQKLRLEQEVREKNRKLEELSLYDALTTLPNRNLFMDRLEQSILSAGRGGKRFAAFMMDLNLFKEINDTFGHEAGDRLLQVVAERLGNVLRESDTAARFGGDEFAALLPSIDSLEGAAVLAQRIFDAVAHPILLNGHLLEIGISIGIGLYPDHGRNAKTLLHAADMAMYAAKRGTKSFAVFQAMDESRGRLDYILPKRLEEGMQDNEFILHFQPKVDLQSDRIAGAEALVRWNHPEFGLVPPMEFIPGAERTALIRPLTMMILESAVKQASQWKLRGDAFPIAVNLSPRLLSNKGLADQIIDVLDRYDMAPGALTLEVTETGVMTDAGIATDILRMIADRGIQIAIDDFGIGYTSLRYLRDLPIDEVKVDKLFIRELTGGSRDSAIVRSIIELTRGLGITAVCEGIESHDIWNELIALGCERGQGYAIARPMPADQFEQFHRGYTGQAATAAEPVRLVAGRSR